jgi:hypothetical protein
VPDAEVVARVQLDGEPGLTEARPSVEPQRASGPRSNTYESRICAVALVFTRHARKRILERGIRIDEIHGATHAPTVVEEYPDDEPYPSRLVLGWVGGRPLHIVLAGPTVAETLSS